MSNTYLAYLSETTEEDLIHAKKIDKNDHLIFFTGEDACMPCSFFLYLKALKTTPEFIPDVNSDLILGFVVGCQCASTGGTLSIISRDTKFNELDGCEFDVEKGNLQVNVYCSFQDALKKSKKEESRAKTAQKKTESLPSQSENKGKGTVESAVKIETMPEDDTDYKEASAELIQKLDQIDTMGYHISRRADVIEFCLEVSEEGIVSQFRNQLRMRFGEKTGITLYEILQPHYAELKKIIEKS